MWSLSGSWRVPSSLTTVPLTWTRPSRMISSALRRLAMPAFARIFWRRSPVGSSLLPGVEAEVGLVIDSGFLTAGLLFAVGADLEWNSAIVPAGRSEPELYYPLFGHRSRCGREFCRGPALTCGTRGRTFHRFRGALAC